MPKLGEIHGTANGCAACGQQFGALAQFDAHQVVDYERTPAVQCRPAASLGLVQDDQEVWQTAEGLSMRESRRQQFRSRNRKGSSRLPEGVQRASESSRVSQ